MLKMMLQRLTEIGNRSQPLFAIGGASVVAELSQLNGNRWWKVHRCRELGLRQGFRNRRSTVARCSCQQMMERGAKQVDVGLWTDLLRLSIPFGSDVRRCSNQQC